MLSNVFLFFFQAEDGIRDLYVTGVQTCALPIFETDEGRRTIQPGVKVVLLEQDPALAGFATLRDFALSGAGAPARSEERRGGKECGRVWRPGRGSGRAWICW